MKYTISVIGPISGQSVALIGEFLSETEAEKAIQANKGMFAGGEWHPPFSTKVIPVPSGATPRDPHSFPGWYWRDV